MEQALRDHTPEAAAGDRPSRPTRFTPLELAAAEQLIHLSESSCSSGAAFTPRESGPAASASYSCSSPRSVNAPGAPTPAGARVDAEDDGDEQEVGGRLRRNRRYRSIAEIYDATEPAGPRRRKDKAMAGGSREERRK